MYSYITNNPYLTFILLIIFVVVIDNVVIACVNLPNRIMRSWNVHKHGYPPPYCDADGDLLKKDK